MMNAYSEIYLDDAMKNLGEAFDYAVNICKIDPDNFFDLFVSSEIADRFASGNPKYIAGISGTELVFQVLNKVGLKNLIIVSQIANDYSPEYWSGWILAYYQWKTALSFKMIKEVISINSIIDLYPALHEAPEDKFVDVINNRIREKQKESRLQIRRKLCNYSQSTLSRLSGVNLRTLQQYETKSKEINKASISTVVSLSKALGCSIEDLLEIPC